MVARYLVPCHESACIVATLGHRNLHVREGKAVEIEGIAGVGRRETMRHEGRRCVHEDGSCPGRRTAPSGHDRGSGVEDDTAGPEDGMSPNLASAATPRAETEGVSLARRLFYRHRIAN